jgi:hypothetical protein
MTKHMVGRRGVLAGGAGALGLLLLRKFGGSPAAAAAELAVVGVSVEQRRVVRTFDAGFGSVFETAVGAMVLLSCGEVIAAGSQIQVTYDARVFEVSSPMVMTAQRVVKAVAETNQTADTGQVAFRVDQRFGGDAGDVGVLVPLAVRRLYPGENIGRFAAPMLRVEMPDGRTVTAELAAPLVETPVAPWGVEVSGAWTDIPVREGKTAKSYRVPALVQVRSVGPGAVPAGASMTLNVDRAVVLGCVVVAVTLDGSPVDPAGFAPVSSQEGDAYRAAVTIPAEIEAGSVLEMTFEISGAEGARLDGIVFARAVVEGVSTAERPERVTGRTMLIDVTNSGVVDSVGAAAGMV